MWEKLLPQLNDTLEKAPAAYRDRVMNRRAGNAGQ